MIGKWGKGTEEDISKVNDEEDGRIKDVNRGKLRSEVEMQKGETTEEKCTGDD